MPPSPPTTSGRNAASGLVPKTKARTAWAVRGEVSNVNAEFERLRPTLAHYFPFELDGFQKEAVIHLERVGLPHMPSLSITACHLIRQESLGKLSTLTSVSSLISCIWAVQSQAVAILAVKLTWVLAPCRATVCLWRRTPARARLQWRNMQWRWQPSTARAPSTPRPSRPSPTRSSGTLAASLRCGTEHCHCYFQESKTGYEYVFTEEGIACTGGLATCCSAWECCSEYGLAVVLRQGREGPCISHFPGRLSGNATKFSKHRSSSYVCQGVAMMRRLVRAKR